MGCRFLGACAMGVGLSSIVGLPILLFGYQNTKV